MIRIREDRFDNRVYRIGRKGLLWVAGMGLVTPDWNVAALLRRGIRDGFAKPALIPGRNIVTNAGDLHYAEKGAGESVTNAFGVQEMCTAGTPAKGADRSDFTTVASSEKAHDTGYPQTNDGDAENTGAGTDVVTWKVAYTTGDFNATGISHGIITNASPGASEALLTGYAFSASFDKTASDALDVFVNHTMTGV